MVERTTREASSSSTQLATLLAGASDHHHQPQRACQPTLLAIGVLTLPVSGKWDRTRGNLSTSTLRSYHRSVHYAQSAVRDGRVCLRYVVTASEGDRAAHAKLKKENATHGDVLVVPSVPDGALQSVLGTSPPLGSGCVLKILSWLQQAAARWPAAPFLAYADDDTFWALSRVTSSLAWLPLRDVQTHRIYMGAMQYHAFWDFQSMVAHGWYWTFPTAGHAFKREFTPARALPLGASGDTAEHAQRFHRPFAMAHGHAVILSAALARALPHAPTVAAFMRTYAQWAASPLGRGHASRIRRSHKCFIGGDVTIGGWIGAMHSATSHAPEHAPIVAIDMLNFNMMWPWPLLNRSFGKDAARELDNMHAFHLQGASAADPRVWMHLHNVTTAADEAEGTLTTPPHYEPGRPRLRCRHSRQAHEAARSLLDRWVMANVSQPRERSSRWLDRSTVLKQWLFCGLACRERTRASCQREWIGL